MILLVTSQYLSMISFVPFQIKSKIILHIVSLVCLANQFIEFYIFQQPFHFLENMVIHHTIQIYGICFILLVVVSWLFNFFFLLLLEKLVFNWVICLMGHVTKQRRSNQLIIPHCPTLRHCCYHHRPNFSYSLWIIGGDWLSCNKWL